MIGSPIFHHRSIRFNDEVDAAVPSVDTARQIGAMFQDDLMSWKAVGLEAWDDRPLPEKLPEYFSRIWENVPEAIWGPPGAVEKPNMAA